jgi:hypothetical protein
MTITQELQNLNTRITSLEEAIDRLTAAQSAQAVPPEPIYDCVSGEVKWIDISNGQVTVDFPGIGTIGYSTTTNNYTTNNYNYAQDGIIMPGECDAPPTFTDTDPIIGGYDPTAPNNPYDPTEQLDLDAAKCDKICYFLYDIHRRLGTFSTLHSVAELTTGVYVNWLVSINPTWYVSAGNLIEFPVKLDWITATADWLLTLANILTDYGNFQAGFSEEFKTDALCALYNATSGATTKMSWDGAIEQHFNWWSPQAVLMRIMGTDAWMNAICNPDMVLHADAPKFALSCAACESYSGTSQLGNWSGLSSDWRQMIPLYLHFSPCYSYRTQGGNLSFRDGVPFVWWVPENVTLKITTPTDYATTIYYIYNTSGAGKVLNKGETTITLPVNTQCFIYTGQNNGGPPPFTYEIVKL